MAAAGNGHLEVLHLLLSKGAHVNASNQDGRTALMLAAMHRQPKTTQALLDQGAHVNAKTIGGMTPLIYAAASGATGRWNFYSKPAAM